MSRSDDVRVWIVTGSLGALAIGIGLIPLRGLTAASNLAFVFLAFTIVIAELGGRGAALVTALVSAMSLNFFLTEPYLTLAIAKTDDIVAFLALAGCGLIAAAFGRRRALLSAAAGRASTELEALERLVTHLREGAPGETVLGELRERFAFSAIALKNGDGRVLAASAPGGLPGTPSVHLNPATLLPADRASLRFGARGLRLPEGGGRLPLAGEGGPGWLDVWEGDADGLDLDESRALAVAVALLERWVARGQPRLA
jgi:uncharacterized protein DUF4118